MLHFGPEGVSSISMPAALMRSRIASARAQSLSARAVGAVLEQCGDEYVDRAAQLLVVGAARGRPARVGRVAVGDDGRLVAVEALAAQPVHDQRPGLAGMYHPVDLLNDPRHPLAWFANQSEGSDHGKSSDSRRANQDTQSQRLPLIPLASLTS